jgi:PAS domain S-box-containing protein
MIANTEGTKGRLSILVVDDSEVDATLACREIKKAGYNVQWSRVDTALALSECLHKQHIDCILCDHKMPGFSSFDALKIVKEAGMDIPFLIVSGMIGEEMAADAMRAGAHDYINKGNLIRLVPAIERELREVQIRAEKRHDYELMLESERRFRTIAEAAPILIWMTDVSGRIVYVNHRWRDFLSAALIKPYEFDWLSRVHANDVAQVRAKLTNICATKSEFSFEFRFQTLKGDWRHVRVIGSPRITESGVLEGFVGTFLDLTDVIDARRAAEEANEAKSSFLAKVSHEIRTPLGAMLGFADLLRDEKLSAADRRHFLDTIVRNGDELLHIIGNILDLSKIESGKLTIEVSTFRIRSLLADVKSLFALKAQEKGINLLTDVKDSVPEWVISDHTLMREILVNLIGNAIKFTDRGEVQVKVEHVKEDQTPSRRPGGMLRIAVEDSGRGISKDRQGELFQSFSQGGPSISRQFGGSGLGLVLARHMSRVLGGDLILESSTPGVGSRFVSTVAVALRPSAEIDRAEREIRPPVTAKPVAAKPPLRGCKILLAEDAVDNQLLVRTWLEKNGAQVDAVTNGEEAIEKALQNDYQLILMDIQMPVLDGATATELLREKGYEKPIVALTAYALKEQRDDLMKSGFNEYLTKPLNRAVLVKIICDLTAPAQATPTPPGTSEDRAGH